MEPAPESDWIKKLLEKLPFNKLTAGQTFQIIIDIILVFYVFNVLEMELGQYDSQSKAALALLCPLLIAWSLITTFKFGKK